MARAARRNARLSLKRVDPWSVFVFSLVASFFAGVALLVAVGVLDLVLNHLGVLTSLNKLVSDITQDSGPGAPRPPPFLTTGRIMGFTALIAALDVVLLTALATLTAFLYNLCASLTGGIEVTLGEES
ncbi:MAG: DUF3566 domain-containing protein [Actinomycetota bacterium]|nr:DUF3566 domain-containing protein [Actinomycetota bacterium]